jgi:hypothetical protein
MAPNLKTAFFNFTAVRNPNLYLQQIELSKLLQKTKLKNDMTDVAPELKHTLKGVEKFVYISAIAITGSM